MGAPQLCGEVLCPGLGLLGASAQEGGADAVSPRPGLTSGGTARERSGARVRPFPATKPLSS